MSDISNAEQWQPRFKLDLKLAKNKHLIETVTEFERWRKTNPVTTPLSITNGWYDVTPEMAEDFLRRNPSGANRKLTLAPVAYYAGQMQRTDWIPTGEPVIFTSDGVLVDGQHRLWAAYLSGNTFTTYIVTDVEPRPLLFAYIDNSKPRTPADALQTSGMNGQSGTINKILHMVELYEHDCYSLLKVQRLPKMSPAEMVHFSDLHPLVPQAVLLMASDYAAAAHIIGHRDVAGFVALRILELHDETTLEDFMNEIATPSDGDKDDDPVSVFQEIMRKDREKKPGKERLKSHVVLGYLIKTFNAWFLKEPVSKTSKLIKAGEAFPRFVEPTPIAQEAA